MGREPCIADDDQVAKWKEIVDAVHAAGGKIFCQIAHGGRAAHPMCNDGKAGVAPSPIALTHRCGKDFNPTGEEQPYVEPPTELTDEAAGELVQAFREAARKAVKVAGFDGVEVYGANGYLIDQFLCETSNKRETGRYAGTTQNEKSVPEGRPRKRHRRGWIGPSRTPHLSIEFLSGHEPWWQGRGGSQYIASVANNFDLAYLDAR